MTQRERILAFGIIINVFVVITMLVNNMNSYITALFAFLLGASATLFYVSWSAANKLTKK